MVFSRLALAVCACVSLTSQVSAEEHVVIITGFSYFPETIHVEPGDTILFVNRSGESQTIVGRDFAWVVGPLDNNEEAPMLIGPETVLDYYSAHNHQGDHRPSKAGAVERIDEVARFGRYQDAPIRATISFSTSPLS